MPVRSLLCSTFLTFQLALAAPAFAEKAPPPPASDVGKPFYDRHKVDVSNLRDFYDGVLLADAVIHTDMMFDAESKWKMTLYQMIKNESHHFQARSAYQLSIMGVSHEEIVAIWSPDYIETIEDPRLRAAFEYIKVVAHLPTGVTADTHAMLRMHYTDRQIVELFQLAAVNTINAVHDNVLPIPTDQETIDWATANLSEVGWTLGPSVSSSPDEQWANPFVGEALETAANEILSAWNREDLGAPNPEFKSDWINYITGYGISPITFDGDGDGLEEPFDAFPIDFNAWKAPGSNEANLPPPGTPEFDVAAYDYEHFTPATVPETRYPFSDRQSLDTEWLRATSMGTAYLEMYYSGKERAFPVQFKWDLFFVYQLASGCVHCQVHGAYGVYYTIEEEYFDDIVPLEERPKIVERIHGLMDFERSDLFTDAEKSAFRLARDAGTLPGRVTAAHYDELRRHYNDREIQEILTSIIAGGWLSPTMQSQATVTDRLSMSFALRTLSENGWNPGVHIGLPSEQRPYHMTELVAAYAGKLMTGRGFDMASEWTGHDVPLAIDSDNDGVEDAFDGFPDDPSRWEDTDRDGIEDSNDDDIDGDGLSNAREISLGIFPYKADSDADGVDDPTEIEAGTDPVDAMSH